MPAAYIQRTLESVLKRAANEFPVVVLTGPRQSGKTTILRHLYGESCQYVSLESPDIRAVASEDPRGFLSFYSPPVIFDEVQYVPDLLIYIKERVDRDRDTCGQYFLTGSQNLLLADHISESLAGRAAILRLLPLSHREIDGMPAAPLPWAKSAQTVKRASLSTQALWARLLRGGYPELFKNPKRDCSLWHASYVQTYLERDVRNLRQVGDLTQFQSFLRALAARSAQLLRLTDLARDLGVAVNTIRAWLSVLEATYQIIILRPYHANIGKRLVKTPKVYFSDVGTLCYLTGLKDPDHAAAGPMGGAIFETAVVSEVMKALIHQGIEPPLYFWRTSSGSEVDLLIQHEGHLIPIEIKLSATPNPRMAAGIKRFRHDLGSAVVPAYVVHSGDLRRPLGQHVTALPFFDL